MNQNSELQYDDLVRILLKTQNVDLTEFLSKVVKTDVMISTHFML